jgi:hypothetical protein
MSDCRYPFFPIGQPMRTIDAHPNPKNIGDLLGGAIPVPLITSAGTVGWVRETCSTEGQPRNLLASMALHILSRGADIPILGPCAITRVTWEVGGATAVGQPEGFGPEFHDGMTSMCGDIYLALAGENTGFSAIQLDQEWADAVRKSADRLRLLPIPDDYPYMGLRRKEPDPIWDGLARYYGGAKTFVPLPL